NLAADSTMTVQSGGQASFTGNYATTNAFYLIAGNSGATASLFSSTGGSLKLQGGALVQVVAGGKISALNSLDIATAADDAGLVVEGPGSQAVAGAYSNWGLFGLAASATFDSGATATFSGGIGMAVSSTPGSSATLSVESGAHLTTGSL